MFEDIFGASYGQGATLIEWLEAREVAKHPSILMTTLNNRELSGPKC